MIARGVFSLALCSYSTVSRASCTWFALLFMLFMYANDHHVHHERDREELLAMLELVPREDVLLVTALQLAQAALHSATTLSLVRKSSRHKRRRPCSVCLGKGFGSI